MIVGRLGKLPMTGGKLGNKQRERIAKMVSKHWVTYSSICNRVDILEYNKLNTKYYMTNVGTIISPNKPPRVY